MDLYGKLNNEIIQKEYFGKSTSTTVTKVDNITQIISTEVNKVPNSLTLKINDDNYVFDGSTQVSAQINTLPQPPVEDGHYRLECVVDSGIVSYTWIRIEE